MTFPDSDQNDLEQGKDGVSSETGKQGEEGENQEISVLSLGEGVPLDASEASECPHTGEKKEEEWDEPTGRVDNL